VTFVVGGAIGGAIGSAIGGPIRLINFKTDTFFLPKQLLVLTVNIN